MSDNVRDGLAESIGDVASWVFDRLGDAWTHLPLTLGVVAALMIGLRLSLVFGPSKTCWRCKGKASLGGWLGGRRACPSCNGTGLRPRLGAGKR